MENCNLELDDYFTIADIRYLDRHELYKTQKPYEVTFSPVHVKYPGAKRTNLHLSAWPVEVSDFSTHKESFSTDVQGFEMDHFSTSLSLSSFSDLDTNKLRYHEEAIEYLKRKFNAERVFIFDTTMRSANKPLGHSRLVLSNDQMLRPANDCHVDQSRRGVLRRVQHFFPNEAEQLLKCRVRVINIWRPLVWPQHTYPLAMCDWRSTDPADFTPSDLKSSVWEGEVLQVHHNPNHKWWFAKRMEKDDVLLIKMYDSDAEAPESAIAMCAPHSSFEWKDAPEWAQPRQSLEIRAILFS
ncbi:hypothetical protein V8C34DRAFT_280886 [Trichoderma compactum]